MEHKVDSVQVYLTKQTITEYRYLDFGIGDSEMVRFDCPNLVYQST